MNKRIKDKAEELENYLSELEEFTPSSFEDYINDAKTKVACERYAEKIIEAIVDLAFLAIKEKKLKMPEDDKQAFSILAGSNIISVELASKLKDAKGMRNILAHEYGEVDNEIIFEAISQELIKDAREFIKEVEKGLK
jgi:uncharacterized protein YutE (UPF0331/DUF86 family)